MRVCGRPIRRSSVRARTRRRRYKAAARSSRKQLHRRSERRVTDTVSRVWLLLRDAQRKLVHRHCCGSTRWTKEAGENRAKRSIGGNRQCLMFGPGIIFGARAAAILSACEWKLAGARLLVHSLRLCAPAIDRGEMTKISMSR